MNNKQKSLVKKWIAALRSGEYKQGRYSLRRHDETKNEDTYCCLGVAKCLISNSKNISFRYDKLGLINLKKLGLTKKTQDYLISINDDKRWSFNRIADYIEKTLLTSNKK